MNRIVRERKPEEPKHLPGDPKVLCQAKIGALMEFPVLEDQGQGYIERIFEKYVRAPGCRVIAVRDKSIYMQHEFRFEQNRFDWRLPGGKVVDKFEDYKQYIAKEISEEVVINAARKEFQEEAGLDAKEMTVFKRMVCGTTVEWDLYYILAKDVTDYEIEYVEEDGHHNQDTAWHSFEKVLELCKSGEIAEGRTVSALIQFISTQP
ncbi:MAG: hypothetical protein CL685_03120 [Candidatus Magasanikbacteria bacterium]|nr:hypothetical protein [Candidatus Magasanikbacteria bacterium]